MLSSSVYFFHYYYYSLCLTIIDILADKYINKAGGSAGAIARTAIAPIERVKIIYQIDKTMRGSYTGIPKKIIAEEGFFGLWRGNSAAVLRVIPYMSMFALTIIIPFFP